MKKELNEGPACSCNITISILVSIYPTIRIKLPTSSCGNPSHELIHTPF
jgi:hypothetical protein